MGRLLFAIVGILLAGCGSIRTGILEDVVETPVYRENRVFYFHQDDQDVGAPAQRRWASLLQPYELPKNEARSIRNGEPVAIIVNGAYVPQTLTDPDEYARLCEIGASRKTRDIAVLANIATEVDADDQFIAIWYQRDVPPDETLSFQDLVVYSDDIWDNRAAPYFRLRIVDVSNERNTATEELLKQISTGSGTITSMLASPAAGFAFNFATRAAQLVLANRCNRTLLDYSFNVFSSAQISAAGGMPLGQFQTGGIILVGLPYAQSNSYWENSFRFDHRLRRVQLSDGSVVDTPFLIATVMRADLFVPRVVARRSQRITSILTDRQAARENITQLIQDVNSLQGALKAYQLVETFNILPSKSAFSRFLTQVETSGGNLAPEERNWLLGVARNVTGVGFVDFGSYRDWYNRCKDHVEFDPETRRFLSRGVTDANDEPCD